MSIEHSPARQTGRAAYTISEFCEAHRISRSQLYKLWANGIGPRRIMIGSKNLISIQAASDWVRDREAAAITDRAHKAA
jgi:hypothetical protein